MKMYESEKKELYDNLMKTLDYYYEEEKKENPKGFDSEAGKKADEAVLEYNRNFLKLKEKYNIK